MSDMILHMKDEYIHHRHGNVQLPPVHLEPKLTNAPPDVRFTFNFERPSASKLQITNQVTNLNAYPSICGFAFVNPQNILQHSNHKANSIVFTTRPEPWIYKESLEPFSAV